MLIMKWLIVAIWLLVLNQEPDRQRNDDPSDWPTADCSWANVIDGSEVVRIEGDCRQ